eukprot:2782923-Prymnesium_polylepis.2
MPQSDTTGRASAARPARPARPMRRRLPATARPSARWVPRRRACRRPRQPQPPRSSERRERAPWLAWPSASGGRSAPTDLIPNRECKGSCISLHVPKAKPSAFYSESVNSRRRLRTVIEWGDPDVRRGATLARGPRESRSRNRLRSRWRTPRV